jgi:hypothetical protein
MSRHDLRLAWRMLWRQPGFALASLITLALGIGANTAVFSVVHAVLLRPLPYPAPGQLVKVTREPPRSAPAAPEAGGFVNDREFLAWRAQVRSCTQLAGYVGGDVTLTGVEAAARLSGATVTSGFFELLGVRPLLGRTFAPEEERPGAAPVAILSHGLWQRQFGGDAAVLGRGVTLDGVTHTVVGVLPAPFHFPEPYEIWRPLTLRETAMRPGGGMALRLIQVLARLKPDAELQQAQAEFDVVAGREAGHRMGAPALAGMSGPPPATTEPGAVAGPVPAPPSAVGAEPRRIALPGPPPGVADRPAGLDLPPGDVLPGETPLAGAPGPRTIEDSVVAVGSPGPWPGEIGRIRLVRLQEHVVGPVRRALLVLLGAVGLVLLIGCANVANLLLARAAGRRREMAVRAALGAGRWQIVRQLLTESGLLSATGAALGLVVATWLGAAARGLVAPELQTLHRIGLDLPVLGFTLVVALGTAILFGLAPALHAASWDLAGALKDGLAASGGRSRLRRALVVGEMALALVLLVGAGLLLRSFVALTRVEAGFEPRGVLTATVNLSPGADTASHRRHAYFTDLLARARALPGVVSAALTDHLPLTGYAMMMTVQVEGRPRPVPGREEAVSLATVSPDYFRAMGIPLRRGRGFSDADAAQASAVVLVNEAFVRRHLEGENPLGRRIALPAAGGGWAAIAGVVGDVRQSGLDREIVAEIYTPYRPGDATAMTLVLRTTADPATLAGPLQAAARELDADQPLGGVLAMETRLAATLAPRRLQLLLLGGLAGLALVLAAVGIYGVMSYGVTQRTREIGVRMAMGARAVDVLALVLREGAVLALAGVGLGLLAAAALSRYLSTLLYGVGTLDPPTFLGVGLGILTVALAACYLPARRAAQVDPTSALRHE